MDQSQRAFIRSGRVLRKLYICMPAGRAATFLSISPLMVKAFKRLLSIKTIVAHKALYDPFDKALEAS